MTAIIWLLVLFCYGCMNLLVSALSFLRVCLVWMFTLLFSKSFETAAMLLKWWLEPFSIHCHPFPAQCAFLLVLAQVFMIWHWELDQV